MKSIIGERIKYIRSYYGETQEQLANSINISKYSVRSWEQGQGKVTTDNVIAICNHYHVSADYLLGLADEDPQISRQQQEELTYENKITLRRFQDFLLSEQKKYKKNTR